MVLANIKYDLASKNKSNPNLSHAMNQRHGRDAYYNLEPIADSIELSDLNLFTNTIRG